MMTRCSLTRIVLYAWGWNVGVSRSCHEAVILHGFYRLMKPQLAIVLERIFRPYQSAVRHRQPIDEARKEKTHGRAACKHRKRLQLGFGKRSHLAVGVEQRPPLGDVVGMV